MVEKTRMISVTLYISLSDDRSHNICWA